VRTEEQKARNRAYARRYYQEHRNNPEFMEQCRTRSLKRYYQVIKPSVVELTKKQTKNLRHTQRVREKQQEVIKALQALLGGKCVNCGITDYRLLDFDHINPLTKTMNISQKLHLPFEELAAEVAGCQLLCPNCHRLKTIEEKRHDSRIRQFRNPKKSPLF
jgi:5-methylcytosine-specific restriction endonuclease McrA